MSANSGSGRCADEMWDRERKKWGGIGGERVDPIGREMGKERKKRG